MTIRAAIRIILILHNAMLRIAVVISGELIARHNALFGYYDADIYGTLPDQDGKLTFCMEKGRLMRILAGLTVNCWIAKCNDPHQGRLVALRRETCLQGKDVTERPLGIELLPMQVKGGTAVGCGTPGPRFSLMRQRLGTT